jgi:threonine synthase
MWRYLPLLPVDACPESLTLQIGWTPFYASRRIGPDLGLDHVWFKDDGRNPTASLKDRASAVAIAKAVELGQTTITAATTGNAGSSLAGLAANAGMSTYIFVPQSAPAGKIAQLRVFGSHLFLVDGNYDQAFDLCLEATERFGWYNRNTAFNPYMVEGKKTVAFEMAEQLRFSVPDAVIVPVGDGCIVSGVAKGFRDLLALRLIDHMPRLIAVQAEGCSPIARAITTGEPVRFLDNPVSCADSIVAGIPRNHLMAIRDVQSSGGTAVTVSDDEIVDAIGFLGRNEGIFAEPAAAASVAALQKLADHGELHRSDRVAVLITGNGLKDIQNALKVRGTSMVVPAHIDAVTAAVSGGF